MTFVAFLMFCNHSTSPVRYPLAGHADISEKGDPTETFVYICHPQWADAVRLFGTRATRATNGDGAVIVGYDGKQLSLKWYRRSEESFTLGEFGIFNYML